MRLPITISILLLILLTASQSLFAQALADRVPADAIVYVGWQGTAALPPEYANSHLKAMLDAMDATKQLSAMVDAALAKQTDAKKADAGKKFVALVNGLIQHPGALYFAGVDFSTPDKPVPKIALISQADADAPTMLDQANQWIDSAKKDRPDAPLKAEIFGGKYLVITVGQAPNAAALVNGSIGADVAVPPLASNKDFQSAVKQVQKDAVLTVYVSTPQLVKFLDDATAARPDPQVMDRWNRAKAVLNIEAIQEIIYTGTFDKQDWSSHTFIGLQADRTGIASLFDHPGMSGDSPKLIPQDAAFAGVIRFDLARVITELRAAAGRFNDNGQQQFDKMLQGATSFIGLDVEKDLAACLSDEWVCYGSPPTYNVVPNFTLINHLKDAAKAQKTFSSLEDFINGRIGERAGGKGPQFSVVKVQDFDIHTLTIPNAALAPSWAIEKGNFYFSTTSLGVVSAILHDGSKDKSIEDNDGFAALRGRLGIKDLAGFASFMYSDLPKTAPGIYETMTKQLAQAAQNNPDAPHITLPPYEKIAGDLTPSLQVSYVDAAGWHSSDIEPFPGSNAFGGMQGLVRAMVQPALDRARGSAMVTADLAHLRQIAVMSMTYANDHNGTLPPDLGSLFIGKYAPDAHALLSPAAAKTIPANFATLKPEDQAAWINKNTDYVYLLANKKLADIPNPATTVAIYQETKAPRAGYIMVFADGHAEFTTRQQGAALLGTP